MKSIKYTYHAIERMEKRDISEMDIEHAINNPRETVDARGGLVAIHSRKGDALLRIIYKDEGEYYLIITAYLTDFGRYGRE